MDLEDRRQDPADQRAGIQPGTGPKPMITPQPRSERPAMRTLRTVAELRAALRRRAARPHDRARADDGRPPRRATWRCSARAREECDLVVVSLFVNPSQFNERADLERYPRDERPRRAAWRPRRAPTCCSRPPPTRCTPAGFSTTVEVAGVSERLEGASRGAAHFRGVATVVTKLLCMALPDVAYFGQKDAQQLLVIRRLVADLNLPVRIEAVPTVREPDGLALSSRNRAALRRAARAGARRSRGLAAARERARGRRALRRGAARGRRARCSPPTGSSSSTSRSWTPTASRRLTELDGDGLLRSPRASATCA